MNAKKGRESSIGKWLVIAKFWTFPISIVPIAVGSALSARFSTAFFILMCLGVMALNAMANILNDLFDYRHGVDKADDPAVIRRKHPLITGASSQKELAIASVTLFAFASSCGFVLGAYRGYEIIALGLIGALAALVYTAGRRSFKSMGLGELAVFMTYGPIMTSAAAFVQSGSFSMSVLYASVPVGIAIAAILLANNVRDIVADSTAGIRTIASRLGASRAKELLKASLASTYAFVGLFATFGLLPITSLFVFITAPYCAKIAREITGDRVPPNSAELASRFAIFFGFILAMGMALHPLI